jgi:hypothetical protein
VRLSPQHPQQPMRARIPPVNKRRLGDKLESGEANLTRGLTKKREKL